MPIQVLPQTLINQIAAGEVVENMASAVKELVENSLDAGARRIEVSLENNLRDAIVADDGSGMDRQDAELSLQRHATSKIRTSEDLFNLHTRGFRGEAVPSIASVSRMEVQTRPASRPHGTRIVVEGGVVERIEPAGCPPGTRIAVRDLFFNTPPRRKFLKGAIAEMNAILRAVVRQALASPGVGFVVRRDGEVVLELHEGDDLKGRFRALMGSKVDAGLLDAGFERGGVRVHGCVARPSNTQADRRSGFLFVNGRPFAARAIQAAIEQAGRGFVMAGRFPIYCLFIEVDPGTVDVNVHPAKEEVRFHDERFVAGTCYHAVRNAFEAAGIVPEVRLGEGGAPDGDGAAPAAAPPSPPSPSGEAPPSQPGFFDSPMAFVNRAFDRKRAREAQVDWELEARKAERQPAAAGELGWAATTPSPASRADAELLDAAAARPPDAPPSEASGPKAPVFAAPGEKPDPDFWDQPYDPEPLGQVDLAYIVARFGPDLLIIDQHAAHERLRFLEIQRRAAAPERQSLLAPIAVDVPADRRGAFGELAEALAECGFELEPMGPRAWNVVAVPADLPSLDARQMILDLLDEMDAGGGARGMDELRERVRIRAACHSSIRAGARLSMAEMRALLEQMRREQLSFTCPHGRPTLVRLTRGELDKQFKRTP